jgi:hypothetical protein
LTPNSTVPHRLPDIQEAQVFLNRLSARLLSTVARVRPDERKDVGGAFLTLFGFMAGHALLETARDALFLGSLSARRLPWVYLAIALVALLLGQREPPFVRRFSTRNELTGWLVFSAAVTLVFWALIGWSGPWIYFALYIWSGVLALVAWPVPSWAPLWLESWQSGSRPGTWCWRGRWSSSSAPPPRPS